MKIPVSSFAALIVALAALAPVAGAETIEFPPVQASFKSVSFQPSGIPSPSAKSAFFRYGSRRRSVPIAVVRAALDGGAPVRLAVPKGFAKSRFRLGVVYRPAPPVTQVKPAATPTSVQAPEPAVAVEPAPVAPSELPPVEAPPPAETRPPAFYVSPAGSDANPGTTARPFLSLGKAYRAAAPGDVVSVAGGVYPAQQTVQYDASKASATEQVTFLASGHAHFTVAAPTSSFWTNIGASHVTFEGEFEFDYVNLREDTHGMSEVVFRRTWIHHLTESGNLDGLGLYENRMGPNDVWPSTGSRQTDATGPDDILNFGVSSSCIPQVCFSRSAKDVAIVGNTFDGAYKTWDGSHSDCIQYTVGQSGYIAGNTFANCQNETLILRDNLGPISNVTIENNYLSRPIEATDPYPVHIVPCANCNIRFNSVPANASLLYPSTSAQGKTTTLGANVYGNIAGRQDGGQCSASTAQGWNWDYNLFIGSGGFCGTHGGTSPNILYLEPLGLKLSIGGDSAAVNFYQGALPVPAHDIAGTSRPQGGIPDAGAFEVPTP